MKDLKYHIITFGCQMNVSDSERMSSVFGKLGMILVDHEDKADVVVINACSIRQTAIDRIWGKIKRFEEISKSRNDRPLYSVLTGCVLPTDRPKFVEKFDLYFPMKELPELPEKLRGIIGQKTSRQKYLQNKKIIRPSVEELLQDKQIDYTKNDQDTIRANGTVKNLASLPLNPISQSPTAQGHYLQIKPKYSNKISALVPIMTGCNAFCTYCAVPYTRGREVSRKPEEIIGEVEKLLSSGYREITLLGQIINKYSVNVASPPLSKGRVREGSFLDYLEEKLASHGINIKDIPELQESVLQDKKLFKFHHLLAVLANLSDSYWLRFTSSHPKWFSKELIDTIKHYDQIVSQIHLPVQAGSDTVLKRMLRPYTIDEYKNIITYIREQITGVSITTDVIVGFCSETEAEYKKTEELFKWAKFDMAFISQYSTRPGTSAQADLDDNVTHEVKVQRDKDLTDILRETAQAYNKTYQDKEVDVLITEAKDDVLLGRTAMNKKIRMPISPSHAENLVGSFVKAKVTKTTPWSLEGEMK